MSSYYRALARQRRNEAIWAFIGTLLAVTFVVTVLVIAGAPTWAWLGFGFVTYYIVGNVGS